MTILIIHFIIWNAHGKNVPRLQVNFYEIQTIDGKMYSFVLIEEKKMLTKSTAYKILKRFNWKKITVLRIRIQFGRNIVTSNAYKNILSCQYLWKCISLFEKYVINI